GPRPASERRGLRAGRTRPTNAVTSAPRDENSMNFRNIFRFRERKAGHADETEAVKPFLEHLEDLRWMLIKMAIVLSVAMVACFFFREELMAFIQRPLHGVEGDPGHGLKSLNPADSFTISFTLAFYGGLVCLFSFSS